MKKIFTKKNFKVGVSALLIISMLITLNFSALNCLVSAETVIDKVYYGSVNSATRTEKALSDYYDVNDDTDSTSYIRKDNDSDTWIRNVPYIFLEIAKDFVLSFDYKFGDTTTADGYIWVTFGNKSKSTFDITSETAFGIGTSNQTVCQMVDSYAIFDENDSTNPWITLSKEFDNTATHSVEFKVINGVLTVTVDGTITNSVSLIGGYKEGFVGIGAGLASTVLSNIKLEVLDLDKVYHGAVNSATRTEKTLTDYYDVTGEEGAEVYTRTSTGSDTWYRSVPYIFLGSAKDFSLSFDYKFDDTTTKDGYIWITFGNESKTAFDTTTETAIGIGPNNQRVSQIHDVYKNLDEDATTNPWVTLSSDFDNTAAHSVIFQVVDGVLTIKIDDTITKTVTLASGYKEGYVGIGVGLASTVLSNISFEVLGSDNVVYFAPKSITGNRTLSMAQDYYIIGEDGSYTRNATSSGTWVNNVPFIFDESYKNFSMEFDYSFANSGEQYIWVTIGNKSKTVYDYTTGSFGFGIGIADRVADTSCQLVRAVSANTGGMTRPYVGTYDGTGTHHVLISVLEGAMYLEIDGVLRYSSNLNEDTAYDGGYVGVGAGTQGTVLSNITVIGGDSIPDYDSYESSGFSDTTNNPFQPSTFTKNDVALSSWYLDRNGMIHRRTPGNWRNASAFYLNETYGDNIRITVDYTETTATNSYWGAFIGFGAPEKGGDWLSSGASTANIIRINRNGAVGYAPDAQAASTWVLGTSWEIAESDYTKIHTVTVELKYNVCYVWIDGKYRGSCPLVNYSEGYIFFGAYSPDVAFGVPEVETITPLKRGTSESTPYGKKALFVGDSISDGASDQAAWANRLQYHYDMEIVNNSRGGWIIADDSATGLGSIQSQLLDGLGVEYDYIVIEGGINDIMRNASVSDQCVLGEVSTSYDIADFDTSTFAGGLEALFYNATTKFSDAAVGYIFTYKPLGDRITDWDTANLYMEAAKQICEKWNVSYLDFWNDTEINTLFETNKDKYMPDSLHVSHDGYEALDEKISIWFESLSSTEYAGYGHVNNDGVIDVRDLVRMKKMAARLTEETYGADIVKDGKVDSLDLQVLRQYILGVIKSF